MLNTLSDAICQVLGLASVTASPICAGRLSRHSQTHRVAVQAPFATIKPLLPLPLCIQCCMEPSQTHQGLRPCKSREHCCSTAWGCVVAAAGLASAAVWLLRALLPPTWSCWGTAAARARPSSAACTSSAGPRCSAQQQAATSTSWWGRQQTRHQTGQSSQCCWSNNGFVLPVVWVLPWWQRPCVVRSLHLFPLCGV